MKHVKVLFVCLGNICRSPTAEGVFRALVDKAGHSQWLQCDSAGTSDWHIGRSPDARTIQAARLRNYDLISLRGRQATEQDFHDFDFVLAMDEDNLSKLQAIQPESARAKLALFLDYSEQTQHCDVPDPYYGGEDGFNLVLDLIEDAATGLLKNIEAGRT